MSADNRCTGMFFAALFQCRPVGAEVQHCFNLALFYQCVTIISMVLYVAFVFSCDSESIN